MKNFIVGVIICITIDSAQQILIDIFHIHGLTGNKHLLLPTLENTTSMALCGLLVPYSQRQIL